MAKEHPLVSLILKTIAVVSVGVTTFFATFFLFFIGLVIVVGILAALADPNLSREENYQYIFGKEESDNQLLAIPVTGIILGSKEEVADPFGFLSTGITYGYEVKKALYTAAENPDIKGIVLEINSPGGTIYGARAIADGVAYYKAVAKKPVITHISGLSASGGYWASIAADSVYADYGSTIGSIGIIFGPFKFYDSVVAEDGGAFVGGVVTQNGVETTFITAGRSKDLGNPYRQLTSEELRILQQTVNNEYDNFVDYVRTRRNIEEGVIRNTIGALIYDNETAQTLGLIDRSMNKQQAYITLAKGVGVPSDDWQVVQVQKQPTFFEAFAGVVGRTKQPQTSACLFTSTMLAYYGNLSALCQ